MLVRILKELWRHDYACCCYYSDGCVSVYESDIKWTGVHDQQQQVPCNYSYFPQPGKFTERLLLLSICLADVSIKELYFLYPFYSFCTAWFGGFLTYRRFSIYKIASIFNWCRFKTLFLGFEDMGCFWSQEYKQKMPSTSLTPEVQDPETPSKHPFLSTADIVHEWSFPCGWYHQATWNYQYWKSPYPTRYLL